MTPEQALKELNENGFEITKIEPNKYCLVDNGMFGFATYEAPFMIDDDKLLEIHEAYLGE